MGTSVGQGRAHSSLSKARRMPNDHSVSRFKDQYPPAAAEDDAQAASAAALDEEAQAASADAFDADEAEA